MDKNLIDTHLVEGTNNGIWFSVWYKIWRLDKSNYELPVEWSDLP